MSLPELQQTKTLLDRATTILLLVPEKPSADAFASMVALWLALQTKKEGKADEVSPSHVPKNLQFLPGSSQVKMRPQVRPDISIDVAGPQSVQDIRVEKLTGGLRIHIMLPEGISITKDQLETHVRALPYDAVVVLGAADLEQLGSLFTAHTDFFYNTPIINIDNRADNEHFGTVNLVDVTAGSIAEVAHEIVVQLTDKIEKDIATNLYAGIVAGTDQFKKPSTTPKSFKLAAAMLEHGADRESVIQHLVKTKPLQLLKLVGRIYARLHYEETPRIFWSILRSIDFQESGATMSDLTDALKELMNNIAGFNITYLIHESDGQYALYVLLGKGLRKRRDEIQAMLSAERENGLLRSTLSATSLAEAERQAQEKVRAILP